MSNSHLFITSGFPCAPLQNGIGRYICHLQRITIKFCKNSGDSRGVRNFLENELIDFARKYPGVVVYVKPRRHKSPCLSAEYLNGEKQYVSCHNFTQEEVRKWMNLLRAQEGGFTLRYRKMWHTDNPSIQGVWSAFTNRASQLNLSNASMSSSENFESTATKQIVELFKKHQKMQMQKTISEGDDNAEKEQ